MGRERWSKGMSCPGERHFRTSGADRVFAKPHGSLDDAAGSWRYNNRFKDCSLLSMASLHKIFLVLVVVFSGMSVFASAQPGGSPSPGTSVDQDPADGQGTGQSCISDPDSESSGIGRALAKRLRGTGSLTVKGYELDRDALRRFYESRGCEPVWLGLQDRVAELSGVLSGGRDEGLELSLPVAAVTGERADFDPVDRELLLSHLALHYASALATGRAYPGEWEDDWAIARPAFDAVGGLNHALKAKRLAQWFTTLPPADDRYQHLKQALVRYRKLAEAGDWPQVPPNPPNLPALKPGMTDDRVETIRRRLIIEGDLSADVTGDSSFDPALEQGVRAFQRRHGISEDGAIGPRTLAAMNIPVQRRIRQILLNLERWRSLPRNFGRNYVFINVPAESLEVVEDRTTVMTMKAVVGDPKHPTPVVQASLADITFNPAWNIPTSIAVKEIWPKAQRDSKYFSRNQIIANGTYSFVQLPGPRNPLGKIKFDTPNRFDVYLHDTPSRGAFEHAARAMSHGCVRLEKPRDLAAYLLDPTIWTAETIDHAIASGATRKVGLRRHLRVEIVYFTSFVDADGTVEFRDDIYGRDKRLEAALQAESGQAERGKAGRGQAERGGQE
jgi:L,D-transpeptidase YcbB